MIFLDSSFIVAVEVEKDQNHSQALILLDKITKGKFGEAIISDYIFDDIVTVTFNKTKNLNKAILSGESLLNSTKIIRVEESLFKESWKIFKEQKNTSFSFTDCSIVALMQENNIKNIATFDKDFNKVDNINVVT